MSEIKVGDRVQMDLSRNTGNSMFDAPDLGVGTVVSTDDESLMTGWYVEVDWDKPWGTLAKRPAVQSLVVVEEAKP